MDRGDIESLVDVLNLELNLLAERPLEVRWTPKTSQRRCSPGIDPPGPCAYPATVPSTTSDIRFAANELVF
ncbi:hypothetical protein AYJ54_42875 [Bradyrhizobium centrolobii]|uniref:Uncharacterized protein n=1 Tax=Bradyrhizobium centrolobii TaxID=1505087 RepID=A0A176Z3N7_9BRAD|nr:hypothetical protein AYJ54_42875 [Bradyrhizobium centrolobii]